MRHAGTVPGDLADHFTTFARTAARRSPVTARLAEGAAHDPEVLALVADVATGRRPVNLLLAAAHLLVLRHGTVPLARWYPTVGGTPDAPGDPYPAFRSLVLRHAAEVQHLVTHRETQTNEVGRCGMLRAGLVAATGGAACTLVDVGCSAGLTLLVDRYRVVYRPGGTAGPPGSPVDVDVEVRGRGRPPTGPLAIVHRVGLDRDPVPLDDAERVRWLVACVWPDDAERAVRLQRALDLARLDPPPVVQGDAVDGLAAVIPPDGAVVVQHSWMAAYLGEERQREFADVIAGLARARPADAPLVWLFAEQPDEVPGLPVPPGDPRQTALVLVCWVRGRRTVVRLGDGHPHGRTLRWFASPQFPHQRPT